MAADGSAQLGDGLTNVVSGLGGANDKAGRGRWMLPYTLDVAQIEAAYRTSWIARKIHDLPPFDMTREWRDWQADDKQIEALEAEERRLGLRRKVRDGLTWARLYGGAALILGLPGNPDTPVRPATKAGTLAYVHLVSRYQLSVTDIDLDITSEFFGQPKFYEMTGAGTNGSVRIHPSRVIPFIAQSIPLGQLGIGAATFWGDPLLMTIMDAVNDATATNQGIAAMVQEAKVDTISIPGLTDLVATAAGEAKIKRRLDIANLFKSIVQSRVMDANEKWETRQLTFTGLPDVSAQFLQIVAGAADIPLTRLLGTAPKGLNATGESDGLNYELMVRAKQESDLRPMLERLDGFLIPSALGSAPKDVYWEFAPLSQLTEVQKATVAKTKAETIHIYATDGLLPDSALAKATQNMLVEDAFLPGLEAALAEAEAAGDVAPIEEDEPDPSAITMGPDGKPLPPQAPQENGAPPQKVAANDAQPRTLYVSRKVVNAGEIAAWAKAQGIPNLQDDLHVTVAYSRTPIDWIATAEDWGGANDKGEITIAPGGPRVVEPLGEMTAVLMFGAWQLQYRHERILAAGASWDWESYQPHVSLTKAPVDLSKVTPYRGKIVLGPEIYTELDTGHGDD